MRTGLLLLLLCLSTCGAQMNDDDNFKNMDAHISRDAEKSPEDVDPSLIDDDKDQENDLDYKQGAGLRGAQQQEDAKDGNDDDAAESVDGGYGGHEGDGDSKSEEKDDDAQYEGKPKVVYDDDVTQVPEKHVVQVHHTIYHRPPMVYHVHSSSSGTPWWAWVIIIVVIFVVCCGFGFWQGFCRDIWNFPCLTWLCPKPAPIGPPIPDVAACIQRTSV